jgi:hypothetical protein
MPWVSITNKIPFQPPFADFSIPQPVFRKYRPAVIRDRPIGHSPEQQRPWLRARANRRGHYRRDFFYKTLA